MQLRALFEDDALARSFGKLLRNLSEDEVSAILGHMQILKTEATQTGMALGRALAVNTPNDACADSLSQG